MKPIKVLAVAPGEAPKTVELDGSLRSMQQLVGGYIEAIHPFDDPVVLVCNEEGKFNGSSLNRALRGNDGEVKDIIAGTFFLCGESGDDFATLPHELMDKYSKRFEHPEKFFRHGNKIEAVPAPIRKTAIYKDSFER